jgi:hypothetical protein
MNQLSFVTDTLFLKHFKLALQPSVSLHIKYVKYV